MCAFAGLNESSLPEFGRSGHDSDTYNLTVLLGELVDD